MGAIRNIIYVTDREKQGYNRANQASDIPGRTRALSQKSTFQLHQRSIKTQQHFLPENK